MANIPRLSRKEPCLSSVLTSDFPMGKRESFSSPTRNTHFCCRNSFPKDANVKLKRANSSRAGHSLGSSKTRLVDLFLLTFPHVFNVYQTFYCHRPDQGFSSTVSRALTEKPPLPISKSSNSGSNPSVAKDTKISLTKQLSLRLVLRIRGAP